MRYFITFGLMFCFLANSFAADEDNDVIKISEISSLAISNKLKNMPRIDHQIISIKQNVCSVIVNKDDESIKDQITIREPLILQSLIFKDKDNWSIKINKNSFSQKNISKEDVFILQVTNKEVKIHVTNLAYDTIMTIQKSKDSKYKYSDKIDIIEDGATFVLGVGQRIDFFKGRIFDRK